MFDVTIYKADPLQQESVIFNANSENFFNFNYDQALKGKWRFTLRACRDTSHLDYYDCEDGVNLYIRLADPCDFDPNTIDGTVFLFD